MLLKENPLLESARSVPGSHHPARQLYSVVRSDAPRELSSTAIGHTYALFKVTRFKHSCEYLGYSREDPGRLITGGPVETERPRPRPRPRGRETETEKTRPRSELKPRPTETATEAEAEARSRSASAEVPDMSRVVLVTQRARIRKGEDEAAAQRFCGRAAPKGAVFLATPQGRCG